MPLRQIDVASQVASHYVGHSPRLNTSSQQEY